MQHMHLLAAKHKELLLFAWGWWLSINECRVCLESGWHESCYDKHVNDIAESQRQMSCRCKPADINATSEACKPIEGERAGWYDLPTEAVDR